MRPLLRAWWSGLVVLGLVAGCTSRPPTLAVPDIADTVTTVPGAGHESGTAVLSVPASSSIWTSAVGPTVTEPPASSAPAGADEGSAILIAIESSLLTTHALPRVDQQVNWDFESAGQKYAAIVGRNTREPASEEDYPAQEAVIIRMADDAVVARYAPPLDRYVHRVDFYDKYAILFVPIFENNGDVGPPTWAIRIDLESGERLNLLEQLGDDLPIRPFSMAVSGSALVTTNNSYVEDPTSDSGVSAADKVCFTAIDIPTGTARQVGCAPDGLPVSFVNATDQGVAYLTYPRDGTLADCRHRFLLDLATGEHRELIGEDNCRVWDGVEVSGWQVWSNIATEDNDSVFMENSTIYARSPEGVVYTLGVSKSSRMFVCGADIYFVIRQDSVLQKTDLDWPEDLLSVVRWRPGADAAEIVYQVDEYDLRRFTPPSCTDGVVTVGYFGRGETGGLTYLQKEWFPARN